MQTETHFRKNRKSIVPCFTLWPHQVVAADISNLKGLSLESQLARMVPGHGHHLFSRICCKMPQASLEARGFTVASHWLQRLKMKTLLTWRKLLCRTCHRWRCLMMTRVSGRCKAMPRKFSLAPWLHQMTRQHFLKSRAIESHCRISSSILFLALFSIKLEHDLIADIWWFDDSWCIRIANLSHLRQGYTWSVRRLSLPGAMLPEKTKFGCFVVTGRGRFSCFVAHPAVLVTILTVANPLKVSYVWYVCWCSTGWDPLLQGFLLCIAQRQLICSSARHRFFDCDATFFWCFVAV